MPLRHKVGEEACTAEHSGPLHLTHVQLMATVAGSLRAINFDAHFWNFTTFSAIFDPSTKNRSALKSQLYQSPQDIKQQANSPD